MKKSLLVLCAVLFWTVSFGQQYSALVKSADEFYEKGNYGKSVEHYEAAFAVQAGNSNDIYNGACAAALAGQTDKAFKWLELAIDKGWTNVSHLKSDGDLKTLYGDKRWNPLVQKAQKKLDLAEVNIDKPLQQELLKIYDDDQNIRQQYIAAQKKLGFKNKTVDSLGKVMNYKDSINLRKIVKILDQRGWVGKDIVGAQANQTFFLVIQHADLDTQKKYLPMMREAVSKGNASAGSLALLEDRIALREGRKQIYGSQVGMNPKTNERYVLPLEDPDNVDKRRASVGLEPLADYVKNWDLIWDAGAYKKALPAYEALAKEKR
ncbi:MAG TPA: DUF6624 domain-containing protein [Flavobacterium sp.]|jgi:hypothetical protein|nr:DUF6624 domain-containing protein [Flavobacterium sp.]